MKRVSLKPQDILICLKLAVWPDENWHFDTLAISLGVSASEAHAGVGRLKSARLLESTGRRPLRRNLTECIVHGVKYFLPAQLSGMTTGMRTAYAVQPLCDHFLEDGLPLPVWPDPEGDTYGLELSPLFHSVPFAAVRDPELYQLLSLVDAIRLHQPRLTQVSNRLFEERISSLSNGWHVNRFEVAA